jgi:hypothetical protein
VGVCGAVLVWSRWRVARSSSSHERRHVDVPDKFAG